MFSDICYDLDYYKNNVSYYFVCESFLVSVLLRCWRMDDFWGDRLCKEIFFLS